MHLPKTSIAIAILALSSAISALPVENTNGIEARAESVQAGTNHGPELEARWWWFKKFCLMGFGAQCIRYD